MTATLLMKLMINMRMPFLIELDDEDNEQIIQVKQECRQKTMEILRGENARNENARNGEGASGQVVVETELEYPNSYYADSPMSEID